MSINMFRHFKLKDFDCPCCHEQWISKELVDMLDDARDLYEQPIIINSGCRCEFNNMNVGGKVTSSHLKGLSVDISCIGSINRINLVKALIHVGFTRIGIGDTFIHCDIDSTKTDSMWLY